MVKNMVDPTVSRTLTLYLFGFIARFALLKSVSISDALSNRVEVSTPVTSWKKAVEGVTLWKQGINPYDSDIFHESPLGLILYNYILSSFPNWLPVIFAGCDVLTAVFLSFIAKTYLKYALKKEENMKIPDSATSLLLKNFDIKEAHFYVAAIYLLCPYAIVSCGGKSTVTFQNLFVAIFILFTVAEKWFLASVTLALLSSHSFYYIALIVPLIMFIYQNSKGHKRLFWISASIVIFTIVSLILIFAFYKLTGSWHFLWSTHGCILLVPDLTPNIGLFWYFFTEMFEHFRVFFICTFQLNVFIYTAPLAVRLRKEPIFFLFTHLIIITIFKSYPCIGDVALYISLLPVWSHLFYFMRQRFIVSCVIASCTLLAPTLWHLWIYSGSANANFYFAITLAFNTGQVFLLTDILSAYIKREYHLENGVKYNKDGTVVVMRLQ